MTATVPNLIGMSQTAALAALAGVGLVMGTIGFAPYSGRPIDTVANQDPVGGMVVPAGTKVNFAITQLVAPFDPLRSVISQYANSPTMLRLVENMDEYVDPQANFTNFYNFVWNVDTAQGFGLDIWGRIVGVSRLVRLPFDNTTFGFDNASVPEDWQPFDEGTFYDPSNPTAYLLPDAVYRTLVLAKALANITATTAPAMNQLFQNLLGGRVYVVDFGGMRMGLTVEYPLTLSQYAILAQSNAFLRPAGVQLFLNVVPTGAVFGFEEMGGTIQPFDNGVFYLPYAP